MWNCHRHQNVGHTISVCIKFSFTGLNISFIMLCEWYEGIVILVCQNHSNFVLAVWPNYHHLKVFLIILLNWLFRFLKWMFPEMQRKFSVWIEYISIHWILSQVLVETFEIFTNKDNKQIHLRSTTQWVIIYFEWFSLHATLLKLNFIIIHLVFHYYTLGILGIYLRFLRWILFPSLCQHMINGNASRCYHVVHISVDYYWLSPLSRSSRDLLV